MGLSKFIRYVDPALYNDYQLESFVQSNTTNTKVDVNEFITKPVFKTKSFDAQPIQDLNVNHPARKYLEDRKVPIKNLFFVDDFAAFVKQTFPAVDKQLYKEPRIIIPFYDRNENLLGVQGRAIGASKIKYITIKNDESVPKIFGWDRVETGKTMYVVEGPIDSLFLVNCLATMDASLYHAASVVGLDFDYVFVYDNEPRNKQIVSNMRKTIDMGRKICVWPSDIKEKDINEMVLTGKHPSQIQHIIDNNTFSGLEATMKMNMWSRV